MMGGKRSGATPLRGAPMVIARLLAMTLVLLATQACGDEKRPETGARLSLKAQNQTMGAIVAQVTRQTGFAVELPPALEVAETTVEVKNEPLKEGLRQILDSLHLRGYIIEVREEAKVARVLFADDAPSKLSPLTPANPAGDIPPAPEAGDPAARPSTPANQAVSPPPDMKWMVPPDRTDGQ